jgi:DNA-binding ferritin-like protein (Dps family)
VEVRRAVSVNRQKTESAKVRVETVIREIETVKEVVPEEFRQQLTEIQGELFKVTVELREAHESLQTAENEIGLLEKAQAGLREWGIVQQQVAEANGEGWRQAEAKERAASALAGKRGALLGTMGGLAAAFFGLRFVMFSIPWTYLIPVVTGIAGYFASRTFL